MLVEKTFDAGLVKINYVEGLAGGQPLVMLHGATMRWQTFIPVLPLFASRYYTFALDLRGHGSSGRAPGAYRMKDYAQDVIQFIREQVKEPAILVGWSLGAHVAIQVAATVPELVYAVILEEPPLRSVSQERFDANPIYPVLRPVHDLLITAPSMHEIQSTVAEIFIEADEVDIRAIAKAWSQTDADAVAHLLDHRVHLHFHLESVLPQVHCPVLLLQGNTTMGAQLADQDVVWAKSLLAQCTHVQWQDVDHNFHHPQPNRYYQVVSHFLESL